MAKAIKRGGGFTSAGRLAAAEAVRERHRGWPEHIKKPKDREAHIAKRMNGRRYDDTDASLRRDREIKVKNIAMKERCDDRFGAGTWDQFQLELEV